MELKLCGDAVTGRDGSESGWGWVAMETKSAGMGGNGCDFCPRAGLYF